MQLEIRTVTCPSCWQPHELQIDPSAGDQRYVEDCSVCCRPMLVTVSAGSDGALSVEVERE